MSAVFADTNYWIALLNPKDDLHEKVLSFSESLEGRQIFTSEMVLTQLLDDFSSRGEALRRAATLLVQQMFWNRNLRVVAQTSEQFRDALALYGKRGDKEWSLTDCASFQVMEEHRLTQALTHDHHFQQAGFQALLR
jgi:predicted nucleic acid-binding protein